MSTEAKKSELKVNEPWVRALIVLLFLIIYRVVEVVIVAVSLLQFLMSVIVKERNGRLMRAGEILSRYMYEMMRFVTYRSDTKPFPFKDLPSEGDTDLPRAANG